MDLLSDLLESVRLSGSVFFQASFSSPWRVRSASTEALAAALRMGNQQLILFHYVAEGACWAEVEGARVELASGDVFVLPFGHEHVMGQGEARDTREVSQLFPAPPPWRRPPRITTGGGGASTEIVCGFLHADAALFNPLFEALPKLLVVPAASGPRAALLRASVDFLVQELAQEGPGVASVTARLSELLFVEALRQHTSSLGGDEVGWLAALREPGIRRALEAMHHEPQRDWNADELAKLAAMSRTVFFERFSELVGTAPTRYLTRWRLQRAAHWLLDSDRSMAEIAERVGYGSEAALGRAFKRECGQSPAAWRSAHRR
ncbi:MAG TPA: AraC family transcriptional regulator [Polyangiaceae bacterium]